MTERPLSVLTKAERMNMDLLDEDVILAHYENVY